MTVKEFFKTIRKSGRISASYENIAIELCRESNIDVSERTIRKWLYEERNPNLKDVKLSKEGFITYIEGHTKSTWRDMQTALSLIDNSGIINSDTDDKNKFYNSLFYLFLDTLRIRVPKESKNENELESSVTNIESADMQNKISACQMLDLFKESVYEYDIAIFLVTGDFELSQDVVMFIDKIKTTFELYKDSILEVVGTKDEVLYKDIWEFTTALNDYYTSISSVSHNFGNIFALRKVDFDSLTIFEKVVVSRYQDSLDLLCKICNENNLRTNDISKPYNWNNSIFGSCL